MKGDDKLEEDDSDTLNAYCRVEPALSRFCIRCCSTTNDQKHCNSHQDRLGCTTAIPGQYDFPDLGVSCS